MEIEIKDATDADRSASYLAQQLEIDSEGRLRTKLYYKSDDFNISHPNSQCTQDTLKKQIKRAQSNNHQIYALWR